MRQILADQREPRPKANTLVGLTLYLEADGDQAGRGKGIVADLGIVNDTAQELWLLNPFELVQFLLVNEAGFPVDLPRKPPNFRVNLARKADWKLDTAFPISAFSRNGQAREVADLNTEVLKLSPHDSCLATFTIDRMVKDRREVPLPGGVYWVYCIVTLINATDRGASRVVESPRIQVKWSPGVGPEASRGPRS